MLHYCILQHHKHRTSFLGNNNLERCEFQNRFVGSYSISGPTASFLYNILNNRSNDVNGTIVFTFREISEVLTFDKNG